MVQRVRRRPVRRAPADAISRPSRATSPGCARRTRRGPRLLGGQAARARRSMSVERSRAALGRGRRAGRPALAGRPLARPRPGLAVDPGGLVVRDVAGLGRRPRPAARARPRFPGRLGRCRAPGDADRLRERRWPRSGAASRAWTASGAPIETGGRLTVDQLASMLDAGGAEAPLVIDVRQAKEYAVGPRPGLAPHRRRLAAGPPRGAAARPPDRDDLRVRLPVERRGVAAPGGRLQRT